MSTKTPIRLGGLMALMGVLALAGARQDGHSKDDGHNHGNDGKVKGTQVQPRPVIKNPMAMETEKSPPPAVGTLNFRSNVGSFKILGGGNRKAEGRLEMNFTGSVLVSRLEGKVDVVGAVRKEIDRKDRNKVVYFSKGGKLIVTGKFSGLQFFGRNMSSKFNGWGVVRLYGEFDRNLETGEYWYGTEAEKKPWNTGGITLEVPRVIRNFGGAPQATPTPRVRDNKAGGA